jgi:hypothetical protein
MNYEHCAIESAAPESHIEAEEALSLLNVDDAGGSSADETWGLIRSFTGGSQHEEHEKRPQHDHPITKRPPI